MPLTPGTRLGPYEILDALGAGGMGEVYRARDPRLGRNVAIKILPPAVAADPERLRRFEQEARAAAALNHPNILAVYDIGTESNATFVVSELLDGQTLREILVESGALPVRKAIDYGVQIAKGLAAAHDKGIVHRDLKPENLFLTVDGRAKILDFGLAKLTEVAAAENLAYTPTGSPTAVPRTEPGTVLGTVGYMSPEQVRGRAVDHRSDIFSFGAIVYEVLSGRRAFVAESPAETMATIVRSDPPELSTSERVVSPGLERIVSRCLEKSPEARFQSAKDLAFALEAVSGSAPTAVAAPSRVRGTGRERLAWIVAAGFALAFAAALALLLGTPQKVADERVLRYTLAFPEHARPPFGSLTDSSAISPDGRRLAFVAGMNGQFSIWIRELDSLSVRALPGTENCAYPFWSPDSRYLGFFTNNGRTLKKIEPSGGPPVSIAEIPTITSSGASWSARGDIIIGTSAGPILRVSERGGTPTPVTAKDPQKSEIAHRGPQFLPDGRHFLFFASGPNEVNIGSLDGPHRSVLLHADTRATYAPPGNLLFVRQGTLLSQKFDAAALKLTGEPIPVAEDVLSGPATGNAAFSASTTGVLVYRTGRAASVDRLAWFSRTGQPLGTVGEPGDYQNPRLSPDGKRLVVRRATAGAFDIWIMDLNRGGSTRLTVGPSSAQQPIWSPDGSRIAYVVGQPGPATLIQKMASGVAGEEILLKSDAGGAPNDWTPDGRGLLYHQGVGQPPTALMLLPLDGARKPQTVVDSRFIAIDGRFSPDGKWLAYVSTESGRPEVYLQDYPNATAKWPISTGGGIQPVWRRDGRELFYLAADGKLMAVSLGPGSKPEISAPQPLFQTRVVGGSTVIAGGIHHQYDVTADGQKFLILTAGDADESPLTVVVNWPAALKK